MKWILSILFFISLSANGQVIRANSFYTAPVIAGGGTLLLDVYTDAKAAYSLRLLRTAYSGSAIRVRESGGNTETDIGFVNGDLDTATLKTHCGSNSGYITTWYDQSGNGLNLTQTTNANQPRIVNAGVVDRVNTLPATFYSTATQYLLNTSISVSGIVDYYMTVVMKPTRVANEMSISGQSGWIQQQHTTTDFYCYAGNVYGTFSNSTTNQINLEHIYDGGGAANADRFKLYLNASNQTLTYGGTIPTSITGSNIEIGKIYGGGFYYYGYFQEIVLWANDKSGDRTGIETDVNTYYSIY